MDCICSKLGGFLGHWRSKQLVILGQTSRGNVDPQTPSTDNWDTSETSSQWFEAPRLGARDMLEARYDQGESGRSHFFEQIEQYPNKNHHRCGPSWDVPVGQGLDYDVCQGYGPPWYLLVPR